MGRSVGLVKSWLERFFAFEISWMEEWFDDEAEWWPGDEEREWMFEVELTNVGSFEFKLMSELDMLPPPAFGLNDCEEGGAALFSNRAHVAIFVFISPARRKCFPLAFGNNCF